MAARFNRAAYDFAERAIKDGYAVHDDRDASAAMDLLHEFEVLHDRLIADRAIVRRKLDCATR